MEGTKYDKDKPRFDLTEPTAELFRAQVYTLGAAKYADDNWQRVSKERYLAATLRHINSYRLGEVVDDESGLHHLAHAQTCLDFCIWHDLNRHGNLIEWGQEQYSQELKKIQLKKEVENE